MSDRRTPSLVLNGATLAVSDDPFALAKQDGEGSANRPCERSDLSRRCENDTSVPSVDDTSSLVPTVRINWRAQVDVIEMHNESERVLVYEEQHTKLIVLRSLVSSEPREVANKLVDIVTTIGAPRLIQSANGRTYAERVVREIRLILRNFSVVHGDASGEPRRDFRRILRAWMKNHPGKTLKEALRHVQVAENTRPNSRNGVAPSQLFFGQNICEDLCRTIGVKGLKGNVFSSLRPAVSRTVHWSGNGEKKRSKKSEEYESLTDGESAKTKNVESVLINTTEERLETDVKSEDAKESHLRYDRSRVRSKHSPDHHKILENSSKRCSTKRRRGQETSVSSSRLECTYCDQTFSFPSVLKRHVRSHTNERPYVCPLCDKSFKQLGHLSQHSLTHANHGSFRCEHGCDARFESLESLENHALYCRDADTMIPNVMGRKKRNRDAIRLLECDVCKKIFTTKSVLERHVFTHTHERKYSCKICGKRFKQAGHVKSHMLVHTGERKFSCDVCSRRFSLSNSLKKHMYVHNGDKPYQCDVCGSRFLEKRNLNGHLMTHTNERPYSCKICGKRYTLADTLRRHVSASHEDGRTYQCEICAKMFKQLAHLSVHKKVHNDERPFQCHLCEKNFKHKNVLKSHLAVHANVRPFECDLCKATFVRKTNLQTHIASAHMNERPYACTICNKRFKQISHLNGHIIVHSNSMPYQCDFCDRRCNRLDNLKKHMRLHTKKNK